MVIAACAVVRVGIVVDSSLSVSSVARLFLAINDLHVSLA